MYAADLKSMVDNGRVITTDSAAASGDPKLGALMQLPGIWQNTGAFNGRAWNMIALPFGPPGALGDYRLLLNQANETIEFDLVDLGVPNRGANLNDQHLAALRYLQALDQVAAVDAASAADGSVQVPATQDTNDTPKGDVLQPGPQVPVGTAVGIHREPGLFLRLGNLTGPCEDQSQAGPNLARVATIPHGDAVLAMSLDGDAEPVPGPPDLANPALSAMFSALPIGVGASDLNNPYFGPYKHFHDNPFKGNVSVGGFPGFDPTQPLNLLNGSIENALPGAVIQETTTFTVDSHMSGGITNIPFVNCQANTTHVLAIFWVQKVLYDGNIYFVLQYAQRVLLEFFQRHDGQPGLIQWPHITINTLIRQPFAARA